MTAIPTHREPDQAGPRTQDVLLRLSNVRKEFPGVVALRDASLAVHGGQVHALLGENGAGKSTLMAVASGSLRPDAGTIELAGTTFDHLTPQVALQHGLAIVHQHPALPEELTVVENMALAISKQFRRDEGSVRKWAARQLERVGCKVDVETRVSDLGVADRALIELAKALAIEPQILILDEPTAALGADVVDRVFALIRDASARGAAVVYISHRIPEVREIADYVTVMRDGAVRGSAPVDEMPDAEIFRLIAGRPISTTFPPKGRAPDDSDRALVAEHVAGPNFRDVSMTVRPGEIVGLAGIAGNGQGNFLRALAGLVRANGNVTLAGRSLKLGRPEAAREAGIAYIPAARHTEGLMMSMSVRENASLSALSGLAPGGFVRRRAETVAVQHQRDELDIRTPSIETGVQSLSGGNQQKVMIARARLAQPSLLIADEPTQGVDVGARVEIYRILREIASSGIPVIIVSSDGLELAGLCDRVLIFSRGRVIGELEGDQVREEAIAERIVSATSHRGEADELGRRTSGRGFRLRHFATGDYAPMLVLAVAILIVAIYVASGTPRFLSSFNLQSVLQLTTALAFIGFGQLCVIFTGGIDLSVGPLAGMLVVISSFFAVAGKSPAIIALGFAIMLAAAILVGLVNGSMVRYGRFTAVTATLTTYIAVQGVSLLLRPTQGGYIKTSIVSAIEKNLGPIPVVFIVAVAVGLALEYALRRTRWGLALRAAGSDEASAQRLGVRVNRTVVAAYVASAVLTFLGAIILMAQLGIGDPTQGVTYTLASIGAVALAGASLFGGRGAFVGVILGALLVEELNSSTTFLNLSQAWQYWFAGGLTLIAVSVYSLLRRHAAPRAT